MGLHYNNTAMGSECRGHTKSLERFQSTYSIYSTKEQACSPFTDKNFKESEVLSSQWKEKQDVPLYTNT